jgi:hypothetical protein
LGLQAKKSPSVYVGICPKALIWFQHKALSMPQHQPYPHVKPTYSTTRQYAEAINTLELLSKENKTYIQEVISTFLYYARCVDSSMLPALGTLTTQQATPTKNTMKKIKQFLDYMSTNPDAVVTYHASNIVLAKHSNHCISPKAMHEAELQVISSCQAMWSYCLTMARSVQYCRSSKQ